LLNGDDDGGGGEDVKPTPAQSNSRDHFDDDDDDRHIGRGSRATAPSGKADNLTQRRAVNMRIRASALSARLLIARRGWLGVTSRCP